MLKNNGLKVSINYPPKKNSGAEKEPATAWIVAWKENHPPLIQASFNDSGVRAAPKYYAPEGSGAQIVPGEVAEPADWPRSQYLLAASGVKMQNGGGSEDPKPILAPR